MRAVCFATALTLAAGGCGRWGFDETSPTDAACAVTIAPNPARVNFNSKINFAADGGEPGYEFSTIGGGDAAIDASTGELRAGSEAGSTIVEVVDAAGCRAAADVVIGGDALWFAGGSTAAVPSREVWRSTNGTDWTLVGQLPQRRTDGALATFHDQLIYIAGSDATQVNTVYASPDGVAWSTIGQLPSPASNFGFAIHNSQMFVVGGNGNADNVFASNDGATWTTVGHLPDPNHGGSLVSKDGRLWYVGGHDASLYDWVLSSTDGATWTMEGTIPLAREYHSAVVRDSAIWIVGGMDTASVKLTDVSTSTSGTAWTAMSPLPTGRAFAPLVTFLGRVWSLGGSDLGGVWSTDGTTWTQHTSTFPQPRQGGAAAVFTPR